MSSFKKDLLAALQQAYVGQKGGLDTTTIVETEFGDTLPAPKSQTNAPQATLPDRRTQIRQEIEVQQNRIDSVYRANAERWREEKATADRWPVFGVGRMGVPLSRGDTRPEAQKQLASAAAELKRAKTTEETYTETEQQRDEATGRDRSWLSQLWQGATNLSAEQAADILTAGMASTVLDSRINPILEKASRGEALTEYEQAVVAARGVTQNAQRYVADQGGATVSHSVGASLLGTAQFAAETAGTFGSIGVGKAVLGGAWKAVGKAAAKEAARTPFRGSMWQDLEERTGDQYVVQTDGTVDKEESSAAARLYKSYMSTFSEGFSEQLGNVVGVGFLAKGVEKLSPKLLGKGVGGALVGGVERLAKATEGVRDVFRRITNYNGTIDEFGEELVNNITEPIFTGEPERIKENFSSKNLFTTLGSVALVGSAMHAAELPSVARHYAQGGKLRKQANQAVAAIDDVALRQGVFDALKKGQTVEQKAAQLSSLDWGNVSPEDAAHVVDAFSSNLRHELFKGVDQEQTAQEEYTRQYALFNAEYGQISHRDTGTVQELLDDEGNVYYLLSEALDDSSTDNTVFVYNAQTGQKEQLDRNRIAYVEPSRTYGQLLDGFNQQIGVSLSEHTETEQGEDPDADAVEAGVSPVAYAQGEAVGLADGRSGEFVGYLPDGAMVRVAVLDEQTGEPNTVEVHRNQIVGLSELEPEVVAPMAEQEVVQTPQTPTVPLQKDGTPDYETMSAAQFREEYSKAYSPEEAVAELEGERTLLGKQIDKLKKGSQSLNRNTREQNRRKIADLQIRWDDITSVVGENTAPVAAPQAPSVVGEDTAPVAAPQAPSVEESMADAPKRLSIRNQMDGYGDPVSLRDYILREIAQGKRFRWKDEGSSRGVASELGSVGKESERRVRIGLLKKDGDTPERYAEHLTEEVAPRFGMTDYNEVRNEVADILLLVNSVGQARKYLAELHEKSKQYEADYADYAEYLESLAEKEWADARAEMDRYYDNLTEEEIKEKDSLFEEELLPLYQNGNKERILQQPIARTPEAYGYDDHQGGNGFIQDQGLYSERGIAADDRGGDLQSGAVGPVGSGGSGSAVEPSQQSDGIEQPAAADLSEVRFSESNDDDTPEMERIKSDAIERGDFMRAPHGNPTHLTERRAAIERTLHKLTREFGVETVQVGTAAELPTPLRASTKGRRFAGLYHKPSGAVYLIASELRDADHATATYLHEVVAHKGLDGLLGKERSDRFYTAVFDALKPEEQARLLERYGSKEIAGDEVVARMAEGDVTPGTMQRIVAAVRRFFREVLGVPLTISDTDIRYILFKSKISLQRTNNLTDAMRAIEADQRMRAVVAFEELRAKEHALSKNAAWDNKEVAVVEAQERFDSFREAKKWAVEHLVGQSYVNQDTGETIYINRKSVDKITSGKAIGKSVLADVHFRALKQVPAIIRHSILVETHPDSEGNPDVVQIQRFYGAIDVAGRLYRVESTVKQMQPRFTKNRYYTYEIQEIESIEDRLNLDRKPQNGNLDFSNSSISATDLLKGVEKSNKEGQLISENADIRLSETPKSMLHRIGGNKKAIGSKMVQVQEAIQDATIKVHLLQKQVQRGGGAITPFTNAYEALNHVDSRADAAMRKYKRHLMDPIVGHIKQWRKDYGLEYENATDYLLAKHSLERHASGINALDEKEGGKWTKEHATTQVEAVESVVPEAQLAAFWADWRKATHEVLEIGVRSGRMGLDEKREILGNGWQYYVPLRGKDFDFEQVVDMRDVFYYEMNRGQGGTSVGKRIANVKAKGRSSKSGDPIAMLQHMANNEIYLSEQNNARRTLFRLVQAHTERTDLFAVRQQWYRKQPDGTWSAITGTPTTEEIAVSAVARKALRTEKEPTRRSELQKQITVSRREREAGKVYTGAPQGAHSVSVMKDGIRHTVDLVDPEVAAAFNRKASGWQSALSQTIGRPTRIMAQLNTSKNPAFILPNFVRDMEQGALYNLVDNEGNVKGFMNHALGSWKVLHRAFVGTDNPLTAAEIGLRDTTSIEGQTELRGLYGKDRVNDTLYDLFATNGGETGYVHIADPKDYQRKLEKEIRTAAGGAWTRKTLKGLNMGLDYMASMSENSVRYATFVSQLETGKSVFDAVVYAKNITVNFNRKGKYAKGIGSLFMFFNAGIQGVDNQLSLIDNRQGKEKKTIRKQRARFIAAKAVQVAIGYYSSYLLGSALSALMGDEGEEHTVSDYERRTNFILLLGEKYLKIPIAIPDRPFYALGVMVGDMIDGKMTSGDVAIEFASMFVDAYNPIQSDFIDPNDGATHLKRLIPSALKPMFDLQFNQDFMGLPINKKKYDDHTPDSQLGLKKTAWWAKAIAKELNQGGGGNDATPAGVDANGEKGILNWLDVGPGSIEHLLRSYSGGVGRIVSDVAALLGGDTQVRRMPIVNRFVGEPYEKKSSSDYYQLKRQIEFRDRNNRKTVANGEQSAIYAEEEFEQKAKTDQQWRRYVQQSDKRIKKLREELDNAPDGSEKYDQLEKEIDRQQRKFVKEYNEQKTDKQ